MAGRFAAHRIVSGGAHHRREQAQRLGAAAIGQAAFLHLARQNLGVRGDGLGGVAQRPPRQGQLCIVGQKVPVLHIVMSEHGGNNPFVPFWLLPPRIARALKTPE